MKQLTFKQNLRRQVDLHFISFFLLECLTVVHIATQRIAGANAQTAEESAATHVEKIQMERRDVLLMFAHIVERMFK